MIAKRILKIRDAISDLKGAIIDFVLPSHCITCGNYLSQQERIVCDVCWDNLEVLPSPFCPVCKNILEQGNLLCRICTERKNLCAVRSLGVFDNYYQKMIHGFKYQQKMSLGQRLGKRLGEKLKDDKLTSGFDCIIPVPLHSTRKRERGFNQSEILAQELSDVTHIPVLKKVLKRTRNTKDQTKLTPEERIENVRGAFTLKDPEKIEGKKIILVDDVMTTGATLEECAIVLREAGVERIMGATIAVALI
ncbi:MAG: ComF family protein [Candidatus Zixiibacteriota bacterium]